MKTRPVRRRRKSKRGSFPLNSIFEEVPGLKNARKLWSDNKRVESAILFLSIVEEHPANIPSLIDAGRALGELFNYKKARELLATVEEVGARSASANFLAGQSYRMLRQYRAAGNSLLKAIELDPNHADARLELAVLLERSGKLDQACSHLIKRKSLMPNDKESDFLYARIQRRIGNQDVAERILKKLTAGNTHPLTKARCYSELCSLYDQQQQYQRAWHSMLAGKETLKPFASTDLIKRRKRLENYQRLAESLTDEVLFKWRERSSISIPYRTTLLTGLPRSGTTLLAKLLDDHSEITSIDEHPAFARFGLPLLLATQNPETLSFRFLNDLPTTRINKVVRCCTEMMVASLENETTGQLLIDKNPSLLPILIPYFAAFSHSPLLLAVRDPRDTLISSLFTYMPINDFTVDMNQVDKAINRICKDYEIWLSIKKCLPKNSWLEVRYENLVSDYENERHAVMKFLDVTPDSRESAANSDFVVHSPSYEQVAAPLYTSSVNRWKNYEPFMSPQQLGPLHLMAERLAY